MTCRCAPLFALAFLLAACQDAAPPTAVAPPDDPTLATADGRGNDRVRGRYLVEMLDDCGGTDWGPLGGCAISGSVTAAQFIGAVLSIGFHPAWRNDPSELTVQPNAKLLATNEGGREHTFTPVEAFGGGFVPILNQLPDTRTVAPECANPAATVIVPPGGSVEVRASHHGPGHDDHVARFQCCIHPWMRTTVHIAHGPSD